jgi:hypothetical protein
MNGIEKAFSSEVWTARDERQGFSSSASPTCSTAKPGYEELLDVIEQLIAPRVGSRSSKARQVSDARTKARETLERAGR